MALRPSRLLLQLLRSTPPTTRRCISMTACCRRQLRPSPTIRRIERISKGGTATLPEYTEQTIVEVSKMIPVEVVMSAFKSGTIPIGPKKFYEATAHWVKLIALKPVTKQLAETMCRDVSISAKDLGALGAFMLKSMTKGLLSTGQEGDTTIMFRSAMSRTMMEGAALMGDPAATVSQYQLLEMFARDSRSGPLAASLHEAYGRLVKVVEDGNPRALAAMAETLRSRGKKREALEMFLRCGEAGDGEGYAYAGRLMKELDNDIEGAKKVWRKGALELDNARCYFDLSAVTPPEDPDHLRFMTKAAASGIKGAAHNLGWFYEKAGDYKMAKEWYFIGTQDGLVISVHFLKRLLKREGKLETLRLWVDDEMLKRAEEAQVEILKKKAVVARAARASKG